MDKILFCKRIAARRKERGYKSQIALAEAYNQRFLPEKDDGGSGILGTIKNYENPNKKGVRLDIVCNLCEILDCDVDYLLGNIDEPRRLTISVADATGLTADASNVLLALKKHPCGEMYPQMLSLVIESPLFLQLMQQIRWCIHRENIIVSEVSDGMGEDLAEYKRRSEKFAVTDIMSRIIDGIIESLETTETAPRRSPTA